MVNVVLLRNDCMGGIINLFLPLFVQVLLLYFLSRLISQFALRTLGRRLYLWMMWPGVMVHELSHFIACLVTFTRVYRVRLFQPDGDTLGFVQHAKPRNPIKNIIIGMAPLFGVTATIWLLAKVLWPTLPAAEVQAANTALNDFNSFQNFFNFTAGYFQQYWHYITSFITEFDLRSWRPYVFSWLMLSMSAQAAPSREDLKHTYFGMFTIAAFFTLLYYLDQWLEVPITWTIIRSLTKPLYATASFLSLGVAFAVGSLLLILLLAGLLHPFRKRGLTRYS